MRFLTLLSLAFLLFSYDNINVHAQDTSVESSPEVAEATTDSDVTQTAKATAEGKQENVFSRATDKQIEEAQKFYRKCKNNETLSERKDCKCAATSYLETRLRLGEDATVEQITAENINTCLKNEESAIDNPDKINIEVTEKQMEEAQGIYNWCKNKKDIATKVDCECLASEFLQKRIEVGPIVGKDIILGNLDVKCKNLVGIAGQQYQQCMSSSHSTYGVEQKKYCECYARAYTKGYETKKANQGPKMNKAFAKQAISQCNKPELYQ